MLDNFSPDDCKDAAKKIKSKFSNIIIEISGGLTLDNIKNYFSDEIDILSLGCLTQGSLFFIVRRFF
jgi:nicotinate-nucleotide pyrophosphorylase (carboxylating)